MKTSLIAATVGGLCLLGFAGAASAECDSRQEAVVGKAIADSLQTQLPPERGQRFVDITRCEGGGSDFDARFRYSVEKDSGTSWVEGRAAGKGDRINDLTFTRVSPDREAQPHARAGS